MYHGSQDAERYSRPSFIKTLYPCRFLVTRNQALLMSPSMMPLSADSLNLGPKTFLTSSFADLAATRHAREQRGSSRGIVDTSPQAGRLQRRETTSLVVTKSRCFFKLYSEATLNCGLLVLQTSDLWPSDFVLVSGLALASDQIEISQLPVASRPFSWKYFES